MNGGSLVPARAPVPLKCRCPSPLNEGEIDRVKFTVSGNSMNGSTASLSFHLRLLISIFKAYPLIS